MKLFKNNDGTIKTLKFAMFNFIVTCLILVLLSYPLIFGDKAESSRGGKTTTTTQVGGDFLPCKECDIEFYNKSINLEFGESIKIKDILDLKDVSIQNVKFSFESDYIEKKTIEGEYYFTTSLSLGETTIKASYDKYDTTLKVVIKSDSIRSASFKQKTYYVKTLGELALDVETVPRNSDLSLIKFTSLDESVAKFSENNKIKGITGGKTKVKLSFGESSEDEAYVYVMNTNFSLKVKVDGKYQELEEYKIEKVSTNLVMYVAIKLLDDSNYEKEDFKVTEVSKGSISTKTSFDEVWSIDGSSLIYKVVINYDPTLNDETENSSTISFKLPDDSEKTIRIYK